MSKTIISIIDDDELVRDAISSLVRSFGWKALAFESASLFLRSGATENIKRLVCDVQMPGMDGVQLQQHLKNLGIQIPTIFITAYPSDKLRKTLMENGALCLLEKPLDPSELIPWLMRDS